MPTKYKTWTGTLWHGVDGDVVATPPIPADFVWPFSMSEPWRREAGESLTYLEPPNVPHVRARDYLSGSKDIAELSKAIDADTTLPPSVYVELEPATVYWLNKLTDYNPSFPNSPNWLGFANQRRRVMGYIGAGVENGTVIRTSPTMIADTPRARDFVLDPRQFDRDAGWAPVPLSCLYLSETPNSFNSNPAPVFITGIDFQGTLQTPFGVYSADAQSMFRRNHGVASPLPYRGVSLARPSDKARLQFCRFQGFGFTLNSAPPFETGCVDTNFGLETMYRVEMDGRISGDIDPTRPLSSGSLMLNKPIDLKLYGINQHHTRRSGWAMNTNTNSQDERITSEYVRTDAIADPSDGWAGDNGGFNGSNVEGLVGQFFYRNVHLNSPHSHINIAVPYRLSSNGTPQPTLRTDRPLIVLQGFRTDDTLYGGCLRINVGMRPNSTGISPVWQRITDLGIAGSGLFDIRAADGTPLTGVRSTAFNAAQHKPETHFVVIYPNA